MGGLTIPKALFLFPSAVLGLVLSLPGCTGCEERTDSGYPDRNYETFLRLDEEVIALGMSEEDVVRILGLPDWRMELPNHDGRLLSLTYGFDPPQDTGVYVVHLTDGRVVEKFFIWGY